MANFWTTPRFAYRIVLSLDQGCWMIYGLMAATNGGRFWHENGLLGRNPAEDCCLCFGDFTKKKAQFFRYCTTFSHIAQKALPWNIPYVSWQFCFVPRNFSHVWIWHFSWVENKVAFPMVWNIIAQWFARLWHLDFLQCAVDGRINWNNKI